MERGVRLIHRLIPKTCAPHAALIFILLLLSIPLYACEGIAAEFTGKVVGVIDGDTIGVMHNGKAEQIRLNGIDCPEKKQPFGTRAKQFTSAQAFGKEVTVRRVGPRSIRTHIGGGHFAGWTQLESGTAQGGAGMVVSEIFEGIYLGELEDEARQKKRGLWADPEPVPPWEWRQNYNIALMHPHSS